jgi:DNA-binding XRE family transcriptional regulator
VYYVIVLKAQIKKEVMKMAITLKAARVNAGFTQKEAAKQLGISKSTLASYEMYRTIPSIDVAHKIAELYGLSVDGIIFLPENCA